MPRIDTDKLLTITNAAKVAGVSRFWMSRQAKAGQIAAVCIDGVWFVDRAAAAAFVRDPSRGRPRTASRG
jgi:hypothetical protein